MANEIKNQEFNKSIKQLQNMVREKNFISLAERFYNLKVEMSGLTRSVKEKETALLAEVKPATPKVEIKKEETPSVVSAPKVEPVAAVKPVAQAENRPSMDNRKNFNNQNGFNRNNKQQNNSGNNANFNRSFNNQ